MNSGVRVFDSLIIDIFQDAFEANLSSGSYRRPTVLFPMAYRPYISVSAALKRLRSPDYGLFDAASRRLAWDSIMATGSRRECQEANEARDRFAFSTDPLPGEKVSE